MTISDIRSAAKGSLFGAAFEAVFLLATMLALTRAVPLSGQIRLATAGVAQRREGALVKSCLETLPVADTMPASDSVNHSNYCHVHSSISGGRAVPIA